ncbi:MAG TPA: restriction endonuclease, partial [Terracidiphilus sp.]|nr:restriction endonuclease [Terracidiphilus sp.]
MRRDDRKQWIEDRTAVAERLVRAHQANPEARRAELRSGEQADEHLFEAAVNHLIAKGRLPRDVLPKSKHEIREERRARLLTHLESHGGCAADADTLRGILEITDLNELATAITLVAECNCFIVTPDRIFLPPDDACLTGAFEELTTSKFGIGDIAATKAVTDYAERSGITADAAALVVARVLERQLKIVAIGEGEYRSRISVQAALRRIRAAFQEYRPYGAGELMAAAETDELTARHILGDLERTGGLRKFGEMAFKPTGSLFKRGWPCRECGDRTRNIDAFHDEPLCAICRSKFPKKYGCVTKTRALREFRLREHELYRLTYIERDNPHYKNASPMQLFLLSQVQELARAKWGTNEPYLISLTEVSPDQLRQLQEDPERLKQLSPEQFERLLADRFEAMGLCVQLIGRTNEPDGGIDLVAYPDPRSNQPKFLLAVQAEHHRTDRKTGAPKVQKFVGAMSAVPAFRLGFVVTNTTFTWTAEEYARNQSHFLRLRSLEDLVRWFRDDFNDESEWREIPEFIEFGGFRVPILKPQLPTTNSDDSVPPPSRII